ncbi:hypothetical protein [Pantoea stewartii]|uniref:hypothetical protein n=1 Tax=Pantoea stewartii TaxID=66269 RepID=UPI003368B9C7
MSTFIAYVISWGMAFLLAAGLYLPSGGLLNLTVTVSWIFSTLGTLAAFIGIITAVAYGDIQSDENRSSLQKFLKSLSKPKRFFSRLMGWVLFLIMTGLLGYAGYTLTAIAYVLASFICRVAGSMAQDTVKKYAF